MSIDKIAVLYFDRNPATPKDYSKRAVRNGQVLFGQNGHIPRVVITSPERAQDFLEFLGASTLAGQHYFDLYLLHAMAQDICGVIDSILLYAAEHPDMPYNIGLIGPSSTNSELERIRGDAAALGVKCNVHHLPSDPAGYLVNKPDADQARRILQQMLEQ